MNFIEYEGMPLYLGHCEYLGGGGNLRHASDGPSEILQPFASHDYRGASGNHHAEDDHRYICVDNRL